MHIFTRVKDPKKPKKLLIHLLMKGSCKINFHCFFKNIEELTQNFW